MPYIYNLGQRLAAVVAKTPNAIAIVDRAVGAVDYVMLDRAANQIANWLLHKGLRYGDVVGIFHDKSPTAYAAMLACLKTGLPYVNLDPDSPWERLRKILAVCKPTLVLSFCGQQHLDELRNADFTTTWMHDPTVLAERQSMPHTLGSDHGKIAGSTPAYLMFTSGSTGTPKGAVMSHANVLNFIDWAETTFEITGNDRLTGANPTYFDNSVFDFYASLFNGAQLLPLSAEEVRDPAKLVRTVSESGCTIWFSVPSLLVYLLTTRTLRSDHFPSMRKIIFGGEGFPKPKLRDLFRLFGNRVHLENVYGPTECTCICSSHRVCEADFEDMQALTTLGYLAPNFSYELMPQNETNQDFGELILTGPQVGLGYYNDPDRTARSFLQNPYNRQFRDIAYRTGDIVERDAEGKLHFRGRVDFQIKHMGYRIELEEIEAVLATLTDVKECAVVYRKIGDSIGQIHAFLAVESDQCSAIDWGDVAANLLPSYMVPRKFTILTQLPKNANGKIDRVHLLEFLEHVQ